MPSLSSISTVWLRVLQSDLEPMITPTSALIVLPHLSAPTGATKTNKPRAVRGLSCADQTRQRPVFKAGQYTEKPRLSRPRDDRWSSGRKPLQNRRRSPDAIRERTGREANAADCIQATKDHARA